MDERDANTLAESIGGEPYNSGGGVWLVLCDRPDGMLRVVSDEADCVYVSRDAFEWGDAPILMEPR